MFIRIKTSSTVVLVVQRKECTALHKTVARHGSDTGTGALVNACVGFIPARFWTIPEAALQSVYTAVCHATSKTVKTNLLLEFPEKKKKNNIKKYIHAYRTERPVPK